ncbi:MAG TPA: hypothetical protein DF480_05075 [Clostridiales bacterium]|nr:hypothetical protein [Clostridiales bacterium]
MSTIILYYSLGGRTKVEAEKLAVQRDAELYAIEEVKRRNILNALIPGCFHSRKRKASEIRPLSIDLNGFDRILIGAPIWGGFPAPAFNTVIQLLPENKEVEVFLCSGGGSSALSEEGTRHMLTDRNCTLVEYRDIKTGK